MIIYFLFSSLRLGVFLKFGIVYGRHVDHCICYKLKLIPENCINEFNFKEVSLPNHYGTFFLSFFKRSRTQVTDSQPCSTTISVQP